MIQNESVQKYFIAHFESCLETTMMGHKACLENLLRCEVSSSTLGGLQQAKTEREGKLVQGGC